MALQFKSELIVFAFVTLGWTSTCLGQTPQPSPERRGIASAAEQLPGQQLPGNISGTIVDQSGAVVVGARVRLTREDHSPNQEVLSGNDGQFSFGNIAPGPFQLTITSEGFETQISSGILRPGEIYIVPWMPLAVATEKTEVQVRLSPTEVAEDQIKVAEEQIKVEEKQRVLGVVPNFYAIYIPGAVPLTPKQKFKLAGKTAVDPFTFVFAGAFAGIEQAQNRFSGYGQGAQGYAKRFGARYADTVTGTFIGEAILPSLLKQDPRYFYKGSGSKRSRILYAIANSVICKGDNGHWQPSYSGIIGSLAAGGISNLYYPARNRNGAGLTLENALIGTGISAATKICQEFFFRKLTRKVPNNAPAKP